eukprot:scaffold116575_cov55-Phaeocystis_antarctica.AAC.4
MRHLPFRVLQVCSRLLAVCAACVTVSSQLPPSSAASSSLERAADAAPRARLARGPAARHRRRRERPRRGGSARLVGGGELPAARVGRREQQLRLREVRGGAAVERVHGGAPPAVAAHAAVDDEAEGDDAQHRVDLVDGRQVAVVLTLARRRVAEEGLGDDYGGVGERDGDGDDGYADGHRQAAGDTERPLGVGPLYAQRDKARHEE